MTLADRPEPAAPDRRGCQVGCLLALLAVLAAGAAGFYLFASGPRLRFANRLAGPVRLAVGSEPARILAPGEVVVLRLARSRTLVAEWSLVQPRSADGQPMGAPVSGSVVLRSPRGTVSDSADTVEPGANYFAPLITNATSGPLRITVNAELVGATDCGCAVRPGARRVFIGYYRLYGNSTVQARGAGGLATFRELGAQVTRRDGTVGLRFDDANFRRTAP